VIRREVGRIAYERAQIVRIGLAHERAKKAIAIRGHVDDAPTVTRTTGHGAPCHYVTGLNDFGFN